MNNPHKAIVKWCEENRPDVVPTIKTILASDLNGPLGAVLMMAGISFEAGRSFQSENPTLPLGPAAFC